MRQGAWNPKDLIMHERKEASDSISGLSEPRPLCLHGILSWKESLYLGCVFFSSKMKGGRRGQLNTLPPRQGGNAHHSMYMFFFKCIYLIWLHLGAQAQ